MYKNVTKTWPEMDKSDNFWVTNPFYRADPSTLKLVHAMKLSLVIDHRSVSNKSVIDPLNGSIELVAASCDHNAVNIFNIFCCFICLFYTYKHNAVDLTLIDTFILFLSGYRSISNQSLRGHWSVKLICVLVQGLYMYIWIHYTCIYCISHVNMKFMTMLFSAILRKLNVLKLNKVLVSVMG